MIAGLYRNVAIIQWINVQMEKECNHCQRIHKDNQVGFDEVKDVWR